MLRMNRAAVTSLVVFLLLVGLAWYLSDVQTPPTAPAPAPPSGTADLSALKIAPEGKMTGYSRDRFPHWSSQGNSCDTREIVLQRAGSSVRTDDRCKAVEGSWVSAYDGRTFTSADDLDIDHTVPLAEAWRSGANKWTDDDRAKFANDLGGMQLIAVSAAANRSKGDQDPAKWKPPARGYWCTYATHWVQVKVTYSLTADQAEHDALADMLRSC